jgi:F0F1-type ATP synthase assembly protein I
MEIVRKILLCATLPGALGSLTWFLCGIKNGWIRNNKYVRKVILEVIGGMLVATFVGYPLSDLFARTTPLVLICFAIGASWSVIIQVLRRWITKFIENILSREGD